jgi:catechol 2,3-dioxygenase-like lactoylglutathione lyase family enzyme
MIRYERLHHISLDVKDLPRAKAFYADILCLQEIPRPPLKTQGVWFAVGDETGVDGQQLHLLLHDGETLRQGGIDTADGHFALRVHSYKETIEWLDRCGASYEARPNALTGFPQIYLLDPDRNIIELNAKHV